MQVVLFSHYWDGGCVGPGPIFKGPTRRLVFECDTFLAPEISEVLISKPPGEIRES